MQTSILEDIQGVIDFSQGLDNFTRYAHPDDEVMFFLPAIKDLESQYEMHLLSFSNGDFDKLGKIREIELEKSCKKLGFVKYQIINDQEIQDGMQNKWPIQKMAEIVKKYTIENSIKGIFTFDNKGVSGHPNHIDVYKCIYFYQYS
ncbi:n-acetylglucosaminyl-phosphatidylinositol de-n-acetylase, putative [Ichthyophthirius multifiliis]|uniref:N-acetylglucosaminylphosphatidylinositol deacetylase n=1 Tax=Ichthyophthirius multifiliis TaxID=5932 RepID=G0R4C4_ICHMU|nr:n-acetylglucosaminyl-phosphatidylinositol de-n-acetylase, putative [Ichthyophthirius multifiliis]EGR27674.1 n-acetylglucosaminyl-phosphatidylinositol de-n-acetylase, putative [Ichthyophthirius multifiliis]|eukprot:XP_004025126.1 n-acetylglucosaminyl-phosphatidylinositol de-n-acetylase, putative [Ichthyophthirius multifiliis]